VSRRRYVVIFELDVVIVYILFLVSLSDSLFREGKWK
jgi:hypothetical protein